MFGVPPNTLPVVMCIRIFCYWVLYHYNMSFKTIFGGVNGAFWWFGVLSEDQEKNCLVALSKETKKMKNYSVFFLDWKILGCETFQVFFWCQKLPAEEISWRSFKRCILKFTETCTRVIHTHEHSCLCECILTFDMLIYGVQGQEILTFLYLDVSWGILFCYNHDISSIIFKSSKNFNQNFLRDHQTIMESYFLPNLYHMMTPKFALYCKKNPQMLSKGRGNQSFVNILPTSPNITLED